MLEMLKTPSEKRTVRTLWEIVLWSNSQKVLAHIPMVLLVNLVVPCALVQEALVGDLPFLDFQKAALGRISKISQEVQALCHTLMLAAMTLQKVPLNSQIKLIMRTL